MAYRSNPQQVAARSPSPPPRINFESLHISPLPCPPEASEQAWSFRCQRSRQVNKSWPKTFLFNIDIILMIKGKYKQVQIVKDSGYKIVQKCVRQDGSHYIVKSYAQHEAKLVQNQIHTYQKLKQPHLHGFPQIKEAFETNQRTYLVFEELGENIETLRQRCGGRFTLKTVIAISLQLLERIEYLHHHEIIHGDVKPSNFLVGKGKMKHKIYLTDFELSTSYIKNGKHVPQEFREKFSGSLRFSSRAANSRLALCRKDDLQSLLYSMIFLVKGELPWMKINSTDMIAANEQLLSLKSNSRQQLLSGLPQAFRQAFTHIDQLKFTSAPDYNRIKKLFNDLARKHGYEKDYKYDWEYL